VFDLHSFKFVSGLFGIIFFKVHPARGVSFTRSRDGAVVARWAHNPEVAGSNPALATAKEYRALQLTLSKSPT
jgi:hypothetical protein